MVVYEELASLELLRIHHIQELPACCIRGLQILSIELLQRAAGAPVVSSNANYLTLMASTI